MLMQKNLTELFWYFNMFMVLPSQKEKKSHRLTKQSDTASSASGTVHLQETVNDRGSVRVEGWLVVSSSAYNHYLNKNAFFYP